MKKIICFLLILVFSAFTHDGKPSGKQNNFIITPASPDRDNFPSFVKSKDLLIFQFDNRPDPDDIHSQAAVGSMIQHSDFDGVNTYAVLGATGTQGHEILNSTSLMNLIFGPEGTDTWTDARSFNEKDGNPNQRWITSVERVSNIAKPILMNGGNVWVMEAGQSHITRDWIEALQANGISQDICKARIFIVQHSGWNHTHNRKEDLEFLKENAEYIRIADGNRDTNDPGEEDNDTPDFQTDDAEVKSHKGLRSAAKTDANPNAATRAIWKEADRIIEEMGFNEEWSSITKGGLDFSDTSEAWWIMDLGDKVNTLPEFWDRYVMAQ